MATRPSSNELKILSPDTPWDPVTIPDTFSRYSGFKYRVWFIWSIWCRYSVTWPPPWLAIICGSDGDLWLWEEEDEEGIREFAIGNEPLSVSQITGEGNDAFQITEEDWNDAFQALEARFSRTTVAASPIAHLPSQARLRFIAWLVVAGPLRKQTVMRVADIPSIAMLIYSWAQVTDLPLTRGTCHACRVSDVLSVWIETMLEVYSRDDVEALPWDRDCNCLHSQLTATADTYLGRGVPETPLERNSPVFSVLYELVVPAWPLLLWVAYRAAANDRAECRTNFMDMIRGPNQDLFAWDDNVNFFLVQNLARDELPTLYPADWNEFMVEIPLQIWLQIRNMTWRDKRPSLECEDTILRVITMLFAYSSTPMTRERILTGLGLNSRAYGIVFETMVRAIDRNYQDRSPPANFDFEEFWTSASLEDWLSACDERLCHGVWHSAHHMGSLQRVQVIRLALIVLPCNLAAYAYSLMRQLPDHKFRGHDVLQRLTHLGPSFAGYLEALRNYRKDVQILVGGVKSIEKNSSTNHTISTHVHENMKRDVSAVMERSVVFLRDPGSYKKLVAYRGTDAQQLLDLLQDLLDLDSFSGAKTFLFKALLRLSRSSGLHPRCLALSEVQKVGQQVTSGGFGDIWKGLVRGQGVCIKIMRIFEDVDIKAALKDFGREAVIWRQLCHPNVLPFFGLYYLDNRLCLVSPWMEYGNIMKYLTAHKPTNAERLSLILDVALGLQYLHEKKIVHGDLKGLNILVTPSHRACIADFGLSFITEAMTVRFTHTTVTARGGTPRYQAPELFQIGNPARSHYGSDVYAFACVCYEILTGEVPFHEIRSDMAVMMHAAQGYRPSRLESCSAAALDGLWELMQKCWEQDAQMRPTASEIVERLAGPSIRARTASSTSDWSDEFTSKFRRSQQVEPLLPSVTEIERMLFGDEAAKACRECFPDQGPSDRKNEEVPSPLAQQPKRRYEDSNPEDAITEQSGAKKSKRWAETPSGSDDKL